MGTTEVTAWARYYDQQRDLIATLRRAGFDVWIVSASPEYVVETRGLGVGIGPERVVGIRTLRDRQRRLTYDLAGCGDVADGENTLIPYIDGKRGWVNTAIFGVTGAAALERLPADRRPRFAAGDSDTDVTFVRDATALRLVLNRNRKELMCHAYFDADGRWLINPMFIEPLPQQVTPYPCSTGAAEDASGALGPALDDAGAIIRDQLDTVF